MLIRRLLAISLLSLGVQGCFYGATIRPEYSWHDQFALAKPLNEMREGRRLSGRLAHNAPLEGHQSSLKVVVEGIGRSRRRSPEQVKRGFPAKDTLTGPVLSVLAGPTLLAPENTDNTELVLAEAGVEGSLRGDYLSFSLGIGGGVGFPLGGRWDGEGTRRLFSLYSDVGIGFKIKKHLILNVGYRFYHISNGAFIFGFQPPNIGYNSDAIFFQFVFDLH